jgi:hypothetical protein
MSAKPCSPAGNGNAADPRAANAVSAGKEAAITGSILPVEEYFSGDPQP